MTLTNEEYVNKNKNYILYIFFLKINLGKIKIIKTNPIFLKK